ncbi:MAG: penicillin-binding transpeptidase domain-containing protein [Patescibacteria group bacterium]
MFRKNREYKISLRDDWINPEETLLDSSSEHQDLEVPISNSIFRFALFFVLILSIVVTVFVFDLSIRRNGYYASMAFQNRSVTFSVPPPRGIIFDRLGRPLVTNELTFDLLAVSKEAKDNDSESIAGIAKILGKDTVEFSSLLSGNMKNNAVFFASSDLSKDQVLQIKFANPKGLYVIPNIRRHYKDSSQFSQVIGYIGRVGKEDINLSDYYHPTDVSGKLGVEAQYEDYLRGKHGKIFFQQGESLTEDPVIGNSVVLNIDYDIQKRLFNELFNTLKDTSYSKAAAVVQNPKTGAVLAMASFPTYDNNQFVEGLSGAQYKSLFENKSRPLFNRVVSGLYNPGSTIKPFMGLMTLEEGVFSSSDTIKDCVDLTIVNPYNPDDTYVFKNWRPEYGPFNLKRAIANSCNIYFFTAGGGYGSVKGLGVEKIANYLRSALADSKLKIDLPGEVEGFVPTPDWKLTARGENWYQGDTYNISIGQGDLLVTPLWLNSYISAIANGGAIYKPLVAKQIMDREKNVIMALEPESIGHLNFKADNLSEVKNAMAETTISGTAKLLGTLPVRSGAKTGTAEVIKGRRLNSIMTAFAPFDNPEISITVLIEGSATNEGLAIRTTYELLKWYFEEYAKPNFYP